MLPLCLSIAVALLDQIAKSWIRARLGYGEFIGMVPGFFDLRYVQNTGAAWGILEGLNHWLILFSVAMLIVVVRFRRHLADHRRVSRFALAAIIGGITGNLVDRVHLSYVVDFLHFHAGGRQFPAFNVADAAICTGAFLFMLAQALPPRAQPRETALAHD